MACLFNFEGLYFLNLLCNLRRKIRRLILGHLNNWKGEGCGEELILTSNRKEKVNFYVYVKAIWQAGNVRNLGAVS